MPSEYPVERNCPHCSRVEKLDAITIAQLKKIISGFPPSLQEKIQTIPTSLPKGSGCEKCNFTGYLGRFIIAEVLEITDDIRKMILEQSSTEEIYKFLRKQNLFYNIFEDGFLKFIEGKTTFEELTRVAGLYL